MLCDSLISTQDELCGLRLGIPATLAALDYRRRTGNGCWLDVSQTEAGVQFLSAQIAGTSVTKNVQGPIRNRDLVMAPHGVFPTKNDDQWIAISINSDEQWTTFTVLSCIDKPEWCSLAGRKSDEDCLDELVAAWTRKHDVDEIEALLAKNGIPAHRATSPEAFSSNPQIQSRGHLVKIKRPGSQSSVVEASPFRLQRTPANYRRSAPFFGRDNQVILKDILGFDDNAIKILEAEGVLA